MNRIQKDSAAHVLLKKLVDLGGVAQLEQFTDLIPANRFRAALLALEVRFLVEVNGYGVKATALGKAQVALYEPLELIAVFNKPLQIVPSRVPKEFTALRMNFGAAPFRAGSEDHKLIPSLMGNTRKLPSGEVVE
jgi:hypothetical protein